MQYEKRRELVYNGNPQKINYYKRGKIMEEKILAKGNFGKINLLTVLFAIGAAIAFYFSYFDWYLDYCARDYHSYIIYMFAGISEEGWERAAIFMALLLLVIVTFFWFSRYEMVVTDRRVYGKAAFGKRVDLPIDKVSSVGTNVFGGVSVATSSGKIVFYLCKNKDEMFEAISKLLIDRKPHGIETNVAPVGNSNVSELKELKELLDGGIITQEEFDAKKKQLLGL